MGVAYRVELTDRGRALLELWETGDDTKYRELLGHESTA